MERERYYFRSNDEFWSVSVELLAIFPLAQLERMETHLMGGMQVAWATQQTTICSGARFRYHPDSMEGRFDVFMDGRACVDTLNVKIGPFESFEEDYRRAPGERRRVPCAQLAQLGLRQSANACCVQQYRYLF